MAQHFSKQPLRTPPAPFSEAQDPTLTSGLFWARLLTYRPLFLLGGLWLTMVCVSAIAYHGLMFNEPIEEVANPTEAPLTVAEALPQSLPAASDTADAAPADATPSGPVALWAMLSLVGLCGFGCFVLTQQIRASARPTKRKKTRPRPVVKAPAPLPPPQPKRLAPYSPQRDGVVVPGHRIVEASAPKLSAPGSLVRPQTGVAPRPSAPAMDRLAVNRLQTGTRAMPRPDRSARPNLPATSLPSHNPAVVPDEADLALDWPEGSVAHALDMRQRRSLSSFM